MTTLYVATRRFHYFEPTDRKGMKLITYENGEPVPSNIVRQRNLLEKGFVKSL